MTVRTIGGLGGAGGSGAVGPPPQPAAITEAHATKSRVAALADIGRRPADPVRVESAASSALW
ncbi:MAG: hypothetical protein WD227_15060 [Vicinamibacterales bacterium]